MLCRSLDKVDAFEKNMCTKRFINGLHNKDFSSFDDLSRYLDDKPDTTVERPLGPTPEAPWDKQQLFYGLKEPFFYRDGIRKASVFLQCTECSRVFPDAKLFEYHEKQHIKARKYAVNGGRKVPVLLPFGVGELNSDRVPQRNSRGGSRSGRGGRVSNGASRNNGNGTGKGRAKKERHAPASSLNGDAGGGSGASGGVGKRTKGGGKGVRKKLASRIDPDDGMMDSIPPAYLDDSLYMPAMDGGRGRRKNILQDDIFNPYSSDVHTFDEKDPEFRKPGSRAPSRKRKNGKQNGMRERHSNMKLMMKRGGAPILQAEEDFDLSSGRRQAGSGARSRRQPRHEMEEEFELQVDKDVVRSVKREPVEEFDLEKDSAQQLGRGPRSRRPNKRLAVEEADSFLPPVLDDETALGIDADMEIFHQEVRGNTGPDRRKKRKKKRRSHSTVADSVVAENVDDRGEHPSIPPVLLPAPLTPTMASPDVYSPGLLTPHGSISPVTGRLSRGATDEETGSEGDFSEMSELYRRNLPTSGGHTGGSQSLSAWVAGHEARGELSPAMGLDGSPSGRPQTGDLRSHRAPDLKPNIKIKMEPHSAQPTSKKAMKNPPMPSLSSQTTQQGQQMSPQTSMSNSQSRQFKVQSATQTQVHSASSQQSLPPPHLVVQKSAAQSASTSNTAHSANSSVLSTNAAPVPTATKRQSDPINRLNGHRVVAAPGDHRVDDVYNPADLLPRSPKVARCNRARMMKPQSPTPGSASTSNRDNAPDFVYDTHDQVTMNKLATTDSVVAQHEPSPGPYGLGDRTPGNNMTSQTANSCPSYSTSPGSSAMVNHGKKKFLRLSGSKDSDGTRVSCNSDRVYNPDEHCGVADANGEPCKKSLTCKKHKINERRNVQGRSQSFDTLLRLHREMAAKTPEGQESAVSKPAVFSARCQAQTPNAQLPAGAPAPLIDLGPNLDLEEALDTLDSLNQQSLFNPDAVSVPPSSAMSQRGPDGASMRLPSASQSSDANKTCRHPRLRYVNTLAERRRMAKLPSIAKSIHRHYRWFHCWRAMAQKTRFCSRSGVHIGNSIRRLKSLNGAWRQGISQQTTTAVDSTKKCRLEKRAQPFANLKVRPSTNRHYADLTMLRQMSVHCGVQTLPPRTTAEVTPQHPQHLHPQQPQQQPPPQPAVMPTPRQQQQPQPEVSQPDLVACQIFAGYPSQRPPMHQVPSQHQQQGQSTPMSRVAVQAAPRVAQEAAYNFNTPPQSQASAQVRIQTSHPAMAGHVRPAPGRQAPGGPVCRNGAGGEAVVTGVNLVNSRNTAAGGQPVYFEFQSAGDATAVGTAAQQSEVQVGYPLIRGGAAPGATARGLGVRTGAAVGGHAAAVGGVHGRRRPAAQQVRLPASQPQSSPQQSPAGAQQPQQQQQLAGAAPARSSQHHVVVQQQTTQPQIIRRAASLSATPNSQAQQAQQQVIPQATAHQVVHATSITGGQLQQQQQQQQQRYVRLVSRTMPADYQTSLALAAAAGGPSESDDDCQIIEMSAAGRPVSIQQHPAVQQQRLTGSGTVGQYPQMVHRVLPAAQQQQQQQASGGLQAQQQAQPTGQIFRRVASQSQVVHRQVQQQQPTGQAGVTAHVQFAPATPETLQIRQPHVVQVRQATQQQQQQTAPQVVAAAQTGGTGLESGILRQRILQQRHEEQQQQQIRQQVFQQQQQLSLDSQRQRSAVAVTSVAPSNLGEVYLQPRVQGHTQFATAGATLRRPIAGAQAAAGVQSGARVLTSAQAGVGVNGANFRNVNGNGDLYTVSNTSDIGRQNSFQSADLQQPQVVESADSSLYSPEPIHPSSSRARIAPPSMIGAGGAALPQQRLIVPTGTAAAASTPRRLLTTQYPSGVTVVQASTLQQHQAQQQQAGNAGGATQQVLITEESATGHRVLTQPGAGRTSSGIPTVVFVEPDLSGQTGSAVQQFAATVPQSGSGQQLHSSIVVTGQPRVVTAAANGQLQGQAGVPAIRHRLVTHLAQHRPATSFTHQQPAAPHM